MTGGFEPGCPACGALPDHPCRRPNQQACLRMLSRLETTTPADLERIAERLAVPGAPRVVQTTPQHPAFAHKCPECGAPPYGSCTDDHGDYLTHKRIHVARIQVGAPVDDEGEPAFRAHSRDSPAQDIARLAYWIRFWEATGAQVPPACKQEVAAAVARWPLGDTKR